MTMTLFYRRRRRPTPRPKPLRENPGGRGSKSIVSIATASCAMRSGKFSVSSAQAREHCEREVGIVKRELELTRREFAVLQKEVEVERGLRKLQDDVADAQKQVPTVPAIVARFHAEQSGLKAEQARLQRELEATTKKVGRLRVDQALGDYSISQLRKETEASKAASIELETSTSRFVMRNINPVAARTLRDFAAQVIDARDGGAVWLSGPAGTA
jgi:chromosome segregation ATPase